MFDGKRLIDRKRADTIVQSDLKLWPFEVLSGARNTPMIQVQFHGGGEQVPPRGGFVHGSHQDERDFFLGTKVMTVLAYFNDSQRQAIQYAGSTSGLNVAHFEHTDCGGGCVRIGQQRQWRTQRATWVAALLRRFPSGDRDCHLRVEGDRRSHSLRWPGLRELDGGFPSCRTSHGNTESSSRCDGEDHLSVTRFVVEGHLKFRTLLFLLRRLPFRLVSDHNQVASASRLHHG